MDTIFDDEHVLLEPEENSKDNMSGIYLAKDALLQRIFQRQPDVALEILADTLLSDADFVRVLEAKIQEEKGGDGT